MGKAECPICGNTYEDMEMTIGDNGNLICCNCAEQEQGATNENDNKDSKGAEEVNLHENGPVRKKTAKKMVCDICHSSDILKTEGEWVCKSCGARYSLDEAKALVKEVELELENKDNLMDTPDKKSKSSSINSLLSKKTMIVIGCFIIAVIIVLSIVALKSNGGNGSDDSSNNSPTNEYTSVEDKIASSAPTDLYLLLVESTHDSYNDYDLGATTYNLATITEDDFWGGSTKYVAKGTVTLYDQYGQMVYANSEYSHEFELRYDDDGNYIGGVIRGSSNF